jgi:hypothetical protein
MMNSDERQWTWMDEGLNSFMEFMAEDELGTNFPSRRGPAKNIVPYMSGDQNSWNLSCQIQSIIQFGNNAYGKPATGLNILREVIMGRELFDYAFKVYANRWKFKHPTPDFFLEQWKTPLRLILTGSLEVGSTDFVDIGINDVKQYYVSETPTKELKDVKVRKGRFGVDKGPFVYLVAESNEELKANQRNLLGGG